MSLIKQSGCEFWIASSGLDHHGFLQDLQIPSVEAPELSQLLDRIPVKPCVYQKSWNEGKSDVLALLHTSGSTGLPKLVPVYLETAATVDGFHLMEPTNGKRPTGVEWTGTRQLCAMPLFHVSIVFSYLNQALMCVFRLLESVSVCTQPSSSTGPLFSRP